MLTFDDTNGQSGAKERDRLDAMLAVGSEFMTSADESGTIQRSGQFVRFDMESGAETSPRFLLLHETSDQYDAEGALLDDADYYALPAGKKLRQRTRLLLSRHNAEVGRDSEFKPVRCALEGVRMPRYTQGSEAPFPRKLWGMHERCYTAIGGKRRLFPLADGKVLAVRDVVERGGRYFYGGRRGTMSRTRSARVTRVEVVPVDPERGKLSAPIFSFPVFSGLGVDVTGKIASGARIINDASLPIADSMRVYAATAGVCWGSDLRTSGSDSVPFGGDAGDLYAVCEPAVARVPGGDKTFLSLLAVYAGDDDVRVATSSGPYRLTCKRTTAEGDTATTKIAFPALPSHPNHYLAARGITLLRTGPNTALLRVFVHTMQSAVPGTVEVLGDVLYFWTQDNGATWSYRPTVAGFVGSQPYGAMLVRDQDTVLVFDRQPDIPLTPTAVWAITPAGFSQIGSIPLLTFREGLSSNNFVPYLAFGFGGVVYRKTQTGVKKRLWMQFDPRWIYEEESTWVLDYPGSRPMLMVSDDGGATWSRRLLPVKWSFLTGFVVSVDGATLAVPVYSPRKGSDQPVRVTIYLSEDGGDTWKPGQASATLPGETRVDGNVVIGQEIGSGHYRRMSQDISDCWLEYNRGELHPMLVVRDTRGAALNSNPARPWMVDARIKEPAHG